MKEKVISAIVNLLKVKTLITLAITMVFVVLSFNGKMPVETTTMVIGMVFTYYFNKDMKGNDNNEL